MSTPPLDAATWAAGGDELIRSVVYSERVPGATWVDITDWTSALHINEKFSGYSVEPTEGDYADEYMARVWAHPLQPGFVGTKEECMRWCELTSILSGV